MSRTYKDRHSRIRYPEDQWDYMYYRSGDGNRLVNYLQRPGVLSKKKRRIDTEPHWMTTPMWFIREFMNRPQRVKGKQWERQIVRCSIDSLLDQDTPNVKRKPHIYYW